jgi:5-methyltetrahydrofolate--homocysteine methyltransferase
MLKQHFCYRRGKDERNIDIPIMVSGTITDASGRTLSGQTVEVSSFGFAHSIVEWVQLCLGADLLKPYLQTLSQNTSFNVSAHPNAGLPNALENMMKRQNRCKLYQRIFRR